jgi:hypothetical protein
MLTTCTLSLSTTNLSAITSHITLLTARWYIYVSTFVLYDSRRFLTFSNFFLTLHFCWSIAVLSSRPTGRWLDSYNMGHDWTQNPGPRSVVWEIWVQPGDKRSPEVCCFQTARCTVQLSEWVICWMAISQRQLGYQVSTTSWYKIHKVRLYFFVLSHVLVYMFKLYARFFVHISFPILVDQAWPMFYHCFYYHVLQGRVRSIYLALWETLRWQSLKGPSQQGKNMTGFIFSCCSCCTIFLFFMWEALIRLSHMTVQHFKDQERYSKRGSQAPRKPKFTSKRRYVGSPCSGSR